MNLSVNDSKIISPNPISYFLLFLKNSNTLDQCSSNYQIEGSKEYSLPLIIKKSLVVVVIIIIIDIFRFIICILMEVHSFSVKINLPKIIYNPSLNLTCFFILSIIIAILLSLNYLKMDSLVSHVSRLVCHQLINSWQTPT